MKASEVLLSEEEWVELIIEAKKIGLSPKTVREFLEEKKEK
ncbi:DNA-binding anti-repressor SinI [Evansella halocellulosilytica]|nr:DNA-binding anti-repressor SinI [Evansella halocellulosilytica]